MPPRSTVKSSASAAAMGFAAPDRPAPAPDPNLTGDAASPAALTRLEGALGELKALAIAPMLRRAIDALRAEDAKTGSEWALKALNQDERSGMAWYVLAVAREKAGDFTNSLKAYESALALLPDESDVANDLGRLAFRMGMKDVAEQLFRRYLASHPDAYGTMSNLATAVRDQGRAAEAIEILKVAVRGLPRRRPALEHARHHPLRAGRPEDCGDLLRRGAAARPERRQRPLQPRQRLPGDGRPGDRPGRLRGGDRARPRRGRPADDAAGPLDHKDRPRPDRRGLGRL